jgi:hypothetical protein
MARSFEILLTGTESMTGRRVLANFQRACLVSGVRCIQTKNYEGSCDTLVVWGVGEAVRNAARNKHVRRGHRAVCFDLGYLGRAKEIGYCRVTVDHDHPWRLFDKTPSDPSRLAVHNITMREDANLDNGHVVVIGMGMKSVRQLGTPNWSRLKVDSLRKRFPKAEIVYRPKPCRRPTPPMAGVRNAADGPIEKILRGARLVACRHSNVSVDAVIAGVPFECEDGAAYWLHGKPFTLENRVDFLNRLAWWQWKPSEMTECLNFLETVL